MELIVDTLILKDIIDACTLLNYKQIFALLQSQYSLNDNDLNKYLDYCVTQGYIDIIRTHPNLISPYYPSSIFSGYSITKAGRKFLTL